MLLKLSDQISECLSLAADARERANAVTDPRRKEDFLDMERRWLRLVESYRFVEQAAQFLEDSHAARPRFAEKPPQTGVLGFPTCLMALSAPLLIARRFPNCLMSLSAP